MGAESTTEFTISFKNPTVLKYTDGQVETSVLQDSYSEIISATSKISKTGVDSGDTVDITFTLVTNFSSNDGDEIVKSTVSYMLQGKRRYFYFIIKYVDNVDTMYNFTINPTPSNATVTINGQNTNSLSIKEGTEVNYTVTLSGYESKTGTFTITEDTVMDITLKKYYSYFITASPSDAKISIYDYSTNNLIASNAGTMLVDILEGTTIKYVVSKTYYGTQTGNATVNSDGKITVTLVPNPEQEITLTPSSVTTSGGTFSYTDNAVAGVDSTNYARAITKGATLTWVFTGLDEIDDNALITNITAYYRISQSLVNSTSEMSIKANNNEIFNRIDDNVTANITGVQYQMGGDLQTTLYGSAVKSSLTLSAKKDSSVVSTMRWHGATITLKYINP